MNHNSMSLSSQLGFCNTILVLLISTVGIVMQFPETYLVLLGVLCCTLTEIIIDVIELRKSGGIE